MTEKKTETAVFAAGCFWGVEDAFRRVDGVQDVRVGYTGGSSVDPTYREVCSGRTGHAEAVKVEFDPSVVTYSRLLEVLFSVHDPSQVNRQGNDVGTQYRSAVFFTSSEQEADARMAFDVLRGRGVAVATELEPVGVFYDAEEYHQRYLEKNPGGYCHIPRRVLEGIGARN